MKATFSVAIAFSAITILVGSFPAYADKPSISQARPLLEATGQALVDVQKCGGDWGRISDASVDFIDECARSDAESDLMDKIYDLAKKERRDAIASSGFTCSGNVSARVSVIVASIKAAVARCKGD
ncbi:MAG: hypothetical protein P4L81_07785 [Candidatus Pacebacteria bacterium]|nr:hypothetical protein [Candidatus Paceibacterota bacterium]